MPFALNLIILGRVRYNIIMFFCINCLLFTLRARATATHNYYYIIQYYCFVDSCFRF